jgi:DNA-binding CsgD family transcriptional regulator
MAGSPVEAVQALREAVSVTDVFRHRGPYAQAVADLSAATPITTDGRSERVAVLRRALEQCPGQEVVAEALLRALLAEAAYVPGVSGATEFAECAAEATRALSLVTTHTADVPADAFVRFLVVNFHLAPPGWDEVRAIVESTRALGTPIAKMITLPAATALCLAQGDLDALASLEAEHTALVGVEPRLPGVRGTLGQLRATSALLAGQWDVLGSLLPSGEDDVVGPARHPELAAVISDVFACIWRSQTGRPTVAGTAPVRPTSHALLTELRTLLAVTMPSPRTVGDPLPEAARLADQLARTASLPRDSAWSTRMVLRARLSAIAGDTVLARRTCAELAPFEDEFAVFSWCVPTGPVGWFTAEPLLMLGRAEEARAANRSAEVASRRLGARFWTARCLIQRVLLFPQDDPQEMRAARDEALAIAEELGSICLFREAQELTTAAAGEPSRTSRLSSREREVLQLIGQGLRNNEIADFLKVSVATVERQCTNMYRKLQVRNRSQALRVVGSW